MNANQSAIRVMHVASGDLWAGAEVQVAGLIGALVKRPGFELAAIVLNEGELANRLRKAGVETRVFPEAHATTWSIYKHMVAFMRDWRPDVVHTHRQKENILGALAARVAQVPICVRTAHGAPEFGYAQWQVYRLTLRRLDRFVARHLQQRVIAVSDELASKLETCLPGAVVCVIPNGIDIAEVRAAAAPPVHLEKGLIHIAYVGRLVPVKRVDVFLRTAAELLKGGHDQYRFHVIGAGPLRADLERLSSELGISEICAFHGFQAEASRWLAAMNCLVLTSDHEGLPMTALEARALGVPVVAHAVGGLVSLLQNVDDCRLVATQSTADVARAIREVSPTTFSKFKYCKAPAQYAIEETSGKHAALYRALGQGSH